MKMDFKTFSECGMDMDASFIRCPSIGMCLTVATNYLGKAEEYRMKAWRELDKRYTDADDVEMDLKLTECGIDNVWKLSKLNQEGNVFYDYIKLLDQVQVIAYSNGCHARALELISHVRKALNIKPWDEMWDLVFEADGGIDKLDMELGVSYEVCRKVYYGLCNLARWYGEIADSNYILHLES